MPDKTICSPCKKEFKQKKAYLEHVCKVNGFKPTDPRHLGVRFLQQSKSALKRGKTLTPEKEKEINKMIDDLHKRERKN